MAPARATAVMTAMTAMMATMATTATTATMARMIPTTEFTAPSSCGKFGALGRVHPSFLLLRIALSSFLVCTGPFIEYSSNFHICIISYRGSAAYL